jgi:hypothetical protein
MPQKCLCGCGSAAALGRKYISGHNLRNLARTEVHRQHIAAALQRAWKTKRQRLPIGARRLDRRGYVVVKVLAGKGPWKLEHVIVAERMLGRTLRPGEIVHHINGDRSDNSETNLFVCRNHSHHNEVHRTEAAALRVLLKAGVVVFRAGRYEAILRSH